MLRSVPQSTAMENCFDSFRSQLVLALNLSEISYYIASDPFALALPGMFAWKHPVRSDFHTEASVTVTFKPTNSTYSFYRLAGADNIARLGPFSFKLYVAPLLDW
jgi:hypothetical protein